MCETELIALVAGLIVLVSEIMPFMKNYKSNGILHAVVCLLNSECIKGALAEPVITDIEDI